MTLTEIKKLLYKQKPAATRFANNGKETFYDTVIKGDDCDFQVFFVIPDAEATDFKISEPAQLLIRWLEKDWNEI